jgi:hypothetical protein
MTILTPTITTPVFNTSIGTSVQEFVMSKLNGVGSFMSAPLVNDNGVLKLIIQGSSEPALFTEVLGGSKIPSFLISPLSTLIISIAKPSTSINGAISLAGTLSPLFAKYIISAIIGLVIFIIVLIIFGIIRKFTDRLLEIKAIKVGDKLIGIAVSCGLLFVVILGGLTVVSKFLSGNATIMSYINASLILKPLYENNFLLQLFK